MVKFNCQKKKGILLYFALVKIRTLPHYLVNLHKKFEQDFKVLAWFLAGTTHWMQHADSLTKTLLAWEIKTITSQISSPPRFQVILAVTVIPINETPRAVACKSATCKCSWERMSQKGNSSEEQQQSLTCDQALSQPIWVQVSRVAKVTQEGPAPISWQQHVLSCQEKGSISVLCTRRWEKHSNHTQLQLSKPKGCISPVTALSKYWAVIISNKLPITCPGDSCSPVVGQPGQAAWQTHGVTRRGDKYDIASSLEPRETLISNIDLKIYEVDPII